MQQQNNSINFKTTTIMKKAFLLLCLLATTTIVSATDLWEGNHEVKWDNTLSIEAAKFADGAPTIAMYNNVDVNLANGTYDDVIGTRMPDGTLHLIHVTSHRVGAQQSAGRPIYINGQAK